MGEDFWEATGADALFEKRDTEGAAGRSPLYLLSTVLLLRLLLRPSAVRRLKAAGGRAAQGRCVAGLSGFPGTCARAAFLETSRGYSCAARDAACERTLSAVLVRSEPENSPIKGPLPDPKRSLRKASANFAS